MLSSLVTLGHLIMPVTQTYVPMSTMVTLDLDLGVSHDASHVTHVQQVLMSLRMISVVCPVRSIA